MSAPDTQYFYDGKNPIRALDGVELSKAELIMMPGGLTAVARRRKKYGATETA